MADPRITEAEWDVMEILWRESPLTSAEIVQRLEKQRGWAANTVRTLLTRLTEKKHVAIARRTGKFLYSPKSSREQCVAREGKSFLGRIFGGAPAPLLLHFAESAKLTPDEARKLREILDRKGRRK